MSTDQPAAPSPPTLGEAVKPTVKISGKEYTVRKRLTVKQVKEGRRIAGAFIDFRDRLKDADADELIKIESEVMGRTADQDNYMAGVVSSCLGLTPEQVDDMEYTEALLAFSDLFKMSTELPKKSGEPYG